MKVKIENSGNNPRDTRVTNAETGELIHGVQRVVLDIDIGRPGILANIYVLGAEVDVQADATVHHYVVD